MVYDSMETYQDDDEDEQEHLETELYNSGPAGSAASGPLLKAAVGVPGKRMRFCAIS